MMSDISQEWWFLDCACDEEVPITTIWQANSGGIENNIITHTGDYIAFNPGI